MKKSLLAKSYAQSIYELGVQEKIDIAEELRVFQDLVLSVGELENLLYLQVFSNIEREQVLNEILAKLEISDLAKRCISFLIQQDRFSLFPLIFKETMILDDAAKGFLRGHVYGRQESLSEADEKKIKECLSKFVKGEVKLDYQQSKTITAGLRIEADDLLLDATLDEQLKELKKPVIAEKV